MKRKNGDCDQSGRCVRELVFYTLHRCTYVLAKLLVWRVCTGYVVCGMCEGFSCSFGGVEMTSERNVCFDLHK